MAHGLAKAPRFSTHQVGCRCPRFTERWKNDRVRGGGLHARAHLVCWGGDGCVCVGGEVCVGGKRRRVACVERPLELRALKGRRHTQRVERLILRPPPQHSACLVSLCCSQPLSYISERVSLTPHSREGGEGGEARTDAGEKPICGEPPMAPQLLSLPSLLVRPTASKTAPLPLNDCARANPRPPPPATKARPEGPATMARPGVCTTGRPARPF